MGAVPTLPTLESWVHTFQFISVKDVLFLLLASLIEGT